MNKKIYSLLLAGLFLIVPLFLSGCGEDNPIAEQGEHFEAEGLLLYDSAGNKLLDYFQSVSNDTLFIQLDNVTDVLQVRFYDEDKNEISAPYDDTDHTFGWVIDDVTVAEVVRMTNDEWKIRLRGLKQGNTQIEFQVLHVGHADFRTIKIPLVVE